MWVPEEGQFSVGTRNKLKCHVFIVDYSGGHFELFLINLLSPAAVVVLASGLINCSEKLKRPWGSN